MSINSYSQKARCISWLFLLSAMTFAIPAWSASTNAYLVVSSDGTQVTFYYDSQMSSRTGTVIEIGNFDGFEASKAAKVTQVTFDATFANARPTSTARWFSSMNNLSTIVGINYLNTSNVTTMRSMFYGCKNLKSLDVSHFNTAKVETMYCMFTNCSSLTSLDLSQFDTSKVTSMHSMFYGCSSLDNLDLSSFNTSKVETMYCMFYNCNSLWELYLDHFDTSSVTSMEHMFSKCGGLYWLEISNFDTSNVTNMEGMFSECVNLKNIDVSSFNTSKVTNMRHTFNECTSLRKLDVSNFNTSKVTNSSAMFDNCYSLTRLSLSSTMGNLDAKALNGVGTEEVPCYITAPSGFDFGTSTGSTFQWKAGWFTIYAPYLVLSSDGTVLTFYYDQKEASRTGEIVHFGDDEDDMIIYMFDNLEEREWLINLPNPKEVKKVVFDSSFSRARPNSCYRWFAGMSTLTTISGMQYLNTSCVTNMNGMFYRCSSLKSLDLSHFNTSAVVTHFSNGSLPPEMQDLDSGLDYMFYGCSSLKRLDLSSFDITGADGLISMFEGCSSLESINLTSFDTSHIGFMDGMFRGCSSLKTLDVSHFDTSRTVSMSHMFDGCSSLTSLDVSHFDTSSTFFEMPMPGNGGPSIDGMAYMFANCSSLTSLDLSSFELVIDENYSDDDYEEGDIMEAGLPYVGELTDGMLKNCSGLKRLTLSYSMCQLCGDNNDEWYTPACTGVGTQSSPCILSVPDEFDFGDVTPTGTFQWKGGWFWLDNSSCTLTASSVALRPGGTSPLVLSLDNGNERVTAIQFDITLPKGVTLAKQSGTFLYTLDTRSKNMTAQIVENGEGQYSIMLLSLSGNSITGTSGSIVTFTLQAKDGLADGTLNGKVNNILLTTPTYDAIHVYPVSFDITISNYAQGDVSHDGEVNVVDVMMTVNHVLKKDVPGFHSENADVDGNGVIDVVDIMGIVDIVLRKPATATSIQGIGTPDIIEALPTNGGIDLRLTNASRYTALEMTLALPSGATLAKAALKAGNGHQVVTQSLGNGLHRVVVYSLSGEPLPDGDALLHLTLTGGGDIHLGDILLTNAFHESLTPQEATGIDTIHTTTLNYMPSYRTDGTRTTPTQRGIVIQNGHKYAVTR